jgi:hypothetical protein
MLIRNFMRRWLRLPGGVALLLGLGALAGGDARADAPQDRPTAPGDLLIRAGAAGISISEGDKGFELLQLGDTPEARALTQLLEMLAEDRTISNDAGIHVSPTHLAGGGGSGFHWAPAPTPPSAAAPVTSAPATRPATPAPAAQTSAPGGKVAVPDKQG